MIGVYNSTHKHCDAANRKMEIFEKKKYVRRARSLSIILLIHEGGIKWMLAFFFFRCSSFSLLCFVSSHSFALFGSDDAQRRQQRSKSVHRSEGVAEKERGRGRERQRRWDDKTEEKTATRRKQEECAQHTDHFAAQAIPIANCTLFFSSNSIGTASQCPNNNNNSKSEQLHE